MAPDKVVRNQVKRLMDLPNIGKASARDLELLGFTDPSQIVGKDPYRMYEDLCALTHQKHDPCVLDVFISVTDFLAGNPARPWWAFTETRKKNWSHS